MTAATRSTPDEIAAVAMAIVERYPKVPTRETDTAVALLALWTLDALDAGHLSKDDASTIWTQMWVDITDSPDGGELSAEADDLLMEGGWLHDDHIGAAPDHARLRLLARTLLTVGP